MERTRGAIVNAFIQLLSEKPVNKITVKDIVERCGVNRNTFYYHFQDIPSLLELVVKEWMDAILQRCRSTDSPMDCITAIMDACYSRRDAILHIYRSVQRDVFLSHLNGLIDHAVGVYAGGVKSALGSDLETLPTLCHFYKCAGMGLVLDWLDQGMGYDMPEFLESICGCLQGSAQNVLLRQPREGSAAVRVSL